MSFRSFLSGLFDKPASKSLSRAPDRVRAGYDAAQTNDENRKHWSMADAMSADASGNPAVRRELRNRCRYEFANNGLAMGIVNTLSQHVVSGGPTLTCGNPDVEVKWAKYAKSIRLVDKLRLIRATRSLSGETFNVRFINERVEGPVKIDVRVYEPDHVSGDVLYGNTFDTQYYYDGIQYDDAGNPLTYYILPYHPGDVGYTSARDAQPVNFQYVYHDFRRLRPGQRRGIPEISPSLPLFSYKRRWTLATVAASETAANLAVLLTTPAPVDPNADTEEMAPFQAVDFERNMATSMPAGYSVNQLKPEQPTTNYEMFNSELTKEIARCVDMPYTVAALDSSKANMSAMYGDWQTYNTVRIIPDQYELTDFLEWLYEAWIAESVLVGDIDESEVPEFHKFLWTGVGEHADPSKVAKANETDLSTGVTNLAKIYARRGEDWEEQQEIAARTFGITVQKYREYLVQRTFSVPNTGQVADPGQSEPDGSKPTPTE